MVITTRPQSAAMISQLIPMVNAHADHRDVPVLYPVGGALQRSEKIRCNFSGFSRGYA
jgi:hypothetical protein